MVKVKKADGTVEEYSEEKIRSSASRVGVAGELQDAMIEEIRGILYGGITTTEIFSIIKNYLGRRGEAHLATKYNLKGALAELGPSGYPFEKFVAELLTARGYTCEVNQILKGACVAHEVDVLAKKDGITWFIEAKFHKNPSQRTDVRVALYIHARYLDLAKNNDTQTAPWIITNTRFSTDALIYARCQDIALTSWGHPKGSSLVDWIESTKLHPVTMLDGLIDEDKRRLLEVGVVTCQQLISSELAPTLIPKERYEQVLLLARRVCGTS